MNINIIKHSKIYFMISSLLVITSILAVLLFGLRLSIDFTGGSRIVISVVDPDINQIENILRTEDLNDYSVDTTEEGISIRTVPIDQNKKNSIVDGIKNLHPNLEESLFETVGPTIGGETQLNAIKAVLVASVAITIYIAFAFRRVSKQLESWKYGITAIITLLHDVIIVVGVYALLGLFLKVEVDALFITAMLTVMGFSVHDTIVVFDRVRESLRKNLDLKFDQVVNSALLETLNRSLNTSITVVIVLLSLILFGGESIRWFIFALIAGVIVGTYSSIFVASPILVAWYNWGKRKKAKKSSR